MVRIGKARAFAATMSLAMVVVVALVMAVAPAAYASKGTVAAVGVTGSPATGDAADGGLFNSPRGIAANSSGAGGVAVGTYYVADDVNHRIQRFSPSNEFEMAWGADVIQASATNNQNGTNFEICDVTHATTPNTAADCKQGVETGGNAGDNLRNGALANPQDVAVDQDTGQVYVSDRDNRRINVYDAGGDFLRSFGFNVVASGPGEAGTGYEVCVDAAGDVCRAGAAGNGAGQFASGSSSAGYRIAVSPPDGNAATGKLVLANSASSSSGRRAEIYNLDGSAPQSFGSSAQFTQSSAPFNVAIDSDGIVYVDNLADIKRYDTNSSSFLAPITGGPTGMLGTLYDASGRGPVGAIPVVEGLEVDHQTGRLLVAINPAGPPGETLVLELSDPAGDPSLFDFHLHDLGNADQAINGIGVAHGAGVDRLFVSASGGVIGHRVLVLDTPVPALFETPAATDIDAHTATLTGAITPNGPEGIATSYRFEYSKTGAEGSWVPVAGNPLADPDGLVEQQVTAPVTGLEANTLYRVRLVAVKALAAGTSISDEGVFVTDAAPPTAVTLPATGRRATAATLQARINPNGSPTTYRFEYGPTTGYGQTAPIPSASAGAGGVETEVSQRIAGLIPNTTYHFRVVAESSFSSEPVHGADMTFTTRAAVGAPQGRGYELVTPPVKSTGPGVGGHGNNTREAGDFALFVGVPSVDGQRLVSSTTAGPVLLPGSAVYVGDYVFSERSPDGWTRRSAFNRRNFASNQVAPFANLKKLTPDLSAMLWDNTGGQVYMFEEMADWPDGRQPSYVSSWDGRWELMQPTEPEQGQGTTVPSSALSDDGSLVALTHPTLRGLAGLDSAGVSDGSDPSVDQTTGATVYLKDLSAGLSDSYATRGPTGLLGVCTGDGGDRTELPDRLGTGKLGARTCPDPVAPRTEALIDRRGVSVASSSDDAAQQRNIVSASGSRVFFMSPDPASGDSDGGGPLTAGSQPCGPGTGSATSCPAQLYVRQHNADGTATTRWVSRPQIADQDASLLAPAHFEGASEDGDKVIFSTRTPLTADDPNGGSSTTTGAPSAASLDLYVYDLPDGPDSDPSTPDADPDGGTLTRISAGPGAPGAGDCNVAPTGAPTSVRFVSDDGRRVYFTCSAELPGVAAPSNGTITAPGGSTSTTTATNLYLYDATKAQQSERWSFVARIPRSTERAIATCASTGVAPGQGFQHATGIIISRANCFRGSSDGAFVTFITTGRLTTDDPDGVSADMYAVDAEAGELTRISAPQGGTGGSYPCRGEVCHADGGFITLNHNSVSLLGVATDPSVAGDRIAYFETRSRLVAEDTDGHMDVYEWRNGDLSLVSKGIDDTNAYYSGNSATGDDVFIVTTAALTWEDIDAVRDVYDVRVGGGIDPPPPTVVCDPLVAADCAGATPPPPGFPPLGTTTAPSAGGGNADIAPRASLAVKRPGRRARRRAARTGVIRLRVAVDRPGTVRAVAKARMRTGKGRVTRRVSVARVRFRKADSRVLRLRLNRVAVRRLRRGQRLAVRVRVNAEGARARTVTVALRRGKRS